MAMHLPTMCRLLVRAKIAERAAAAFQLEGTRSAQANRPLQSKRTSSIVDHKRVGLESERLRSAFLLRRTSHPSPNNSQFGE